MTIHNVRNSIVVSHLPLTVLRVLVLMSATTIGRAQTQVGVTYPRLETWDPSQFETDAATLEGLPGPSFDLTQFAQDTEATYAAGDATAGYDAGLLASLAGVTAGTLSEGELIAFDAQGTNSGGGRFEGSVWVFDDGATTATYTHSINDLPNTTMIANVERLNVGAQYNALCGTATPPDHDFGVIVFKLSDVGIDVTSAAFTVNITGSGPNCGSQCPEIVLLGILSDLTGSAFCECNAGAAPCGNEGSVGNGCANGVFSNGCNLSALGTAGVGNDAVILHASNTVPTQPGLFFQGNNAINGGNGVQFGDGLRCAGGSVVRLEVVTADGTGSASSTVPIAATGGVTPGDIKRYQWWYRDPTGSPCGTGFNLSNGLEVTWAP